MPVKEVGKARHKLIKADIKTGHKMSAFSGTLFFSTSSLDFD